MPEFTPEILASVYHNCQIAPIFLISLSPLKKPDAARGQAVAAVPAVFPPAPPPAFRAGPAKRRATRFLHHSAEKPGKAPTLKPVENFLKAPSMFSR